MIKEPVIASLASIPERENFLQQTIDSVIDQVDILNVYLNEYKKIPHFLLKKKIRYFLSSEKGDFGDAGKFFPLQYHSGFLFTLDDDLYYPSDYVSTMIKKVNLYERSSFICVHGNLLPKNKINSYYKDKTGIHFSKLTSADQEVDVPGTGTLAFHSSLYNVKIQDFPIPNMSDIWLFKIAQKRNIPVISIARKNLWIKSLIVGDDKHSIYSKFSNNDSLVTQIINSTVREINNEPV
ncbi:MAG: hypothetical protein Q8L78_05300 [Coxiellaceae bacterium]|nr:hypothetical protein [Coxiellaceae bacterium]